MKISKFVIILGMTLGVSLIAADPTSSGIIPYDKIVRIILMGKTGAGKSTTVNAFYNFAKKTKWDDFPKLFPIKTKYQACNVQEYMGRTVENHERDQLNAVTQEPSEYTVKSQNYAVSIIDCPGAADPRGHDKDIENSIGIVDFMTKVGNFNAIGIVINGTINRATAEEEYVLGEIKKIIPKSALNRTFILVSHGITKSENVKRFIENAGLPDTNIFYFDNFGLTENGHIKVGPADLVDDSDEDVEDPFSADNNSSNDTEKEKINEKRIAAKRVKETWLNSNKEFNVMIKRASELGRFTSDGMAKISQLKNSVTEKILTAHRTVRALEQCESNLTTAQNDFARALDAYNHSLMFKTDAEAQLDIAKAEQQAANALNTCITYEDSEPYETTYLNTTCLICRTVCHPKCGLENKGPNCYDHLPGCSCMSGNSCTVCPGKCNYVNHRHRNEEFKSTRKVTKTKTDDGVVKRQADATKNLATVKGELEAKARDLTNKTQTKERQDAIKAQFARQLSDLEAEKDLLQQTIVEFYLELDKLCLGSINYHIGEYYDTCIRKEHDNPVKVDKLLREKKFYVEQVNLYKNRAANNI